MGKICLITAISDLSTGGGNHFFNLAKGIQSGQQDLMIICLLPGTLYDHLKMADMPVTLCLVKGKSDLRGIVQLRNLLKTGRPVVVHSHGERAMVLANWLATSLRIPGIIATIHRSIAHATDWPWLLRQGYLFIEDLTLRYATTTIIAVSEAMRTTLIEDRHQASRKVISIHNGIPLLSKQELAKFRRQGDALRTELGLDPATRVVGSVGRLFGEKGYLYLIKAAPIIIKHQPNVSFILVGDGPDRQQLEELTNTLGIAKSVIFAGFQADVNRWLALFDMFVLPSLSESFGLALTEAMMFEMPVIASDIDGPREIVVHQQSGMLIPPANPEALAQAVVNLLRQPEFAQQIGINGHKVCIENFGVEHMVKQTLSLYRAQPAGIVKR